jgi:hypothetical protein
MKLDARPQLERGALGVLGKIEAVGQCRVVVMDIAEVFDQRVGLRQVRTRLAAGGRWIRTLGPPSEGQRFSRHLFPNMRVRHRRLPKRSPAPSSSCFFQL